MSNEDQSTPNIEEFDLPFKSDVVPAVLNENTEIQFRCHKDISCFNACCNQADITLTPYDVIRLKTHLGMTSTDFLAKHTVMFHMDSHGLPGIKMRTNDEGACLFVNEEGCSVYHDRPSACRYYPLGHLAMKAKDKPQEEEYYVMINESHCMGHNEDNKLTIAQYRDEQGVKEFDEYNKLWMQLILKKKSAGPAIGQPPEMSLQLFFMACYDVDRFRRFVMSDSFKKTYLLDDSFYTEVEKDDIALMNFGTRLLRQVLFNEQSIDMVDGALEKRYEERKETIELRRKLEIEQIKAKDPYQAYKMEVESESEESNNIKE